MRALVVFSLIIASGFAAPVDHDHDLKDLQGLQRTKQFLNIGEIDELQRTKKSSSAHHRDTEHEIEDIKARSSYDGYLAGLPIPASYGGSSYAAHPIQHTYTSAIPSGIYPGAALAAASGGYGAPIGGYVDLASGLQSHGPAFGVFSNARLSGCNVPLLLSCSPNVVTGHLAEHHSYGVPAYRSFDEDLMKEAEWAEARKVDRVQKKEAEWAQDKKMDAAQEKEAEWAQARKASHHKVSQDYPEVPQTHPHHDNHHGNHHVVSDDYPQTNVAHMNSHPTSKQPTNKKLMIF